MNSFVPKKSDNSRLPLVKRISAAEMRERREKKGFVIIVMRSMSMVMYANRNIFIYYKAKKARVKSQMRLTKWKEKKNLKLPFLSYLGLALTKL